MLNGRKFQSGHIKLVFNVIFSHMNKNLKPETVQIVHATKMCVIQSGILLSPCKFKYFKVKLPVAEEDKNQENQGKS